MEFYNEDPMDIDPPSFSQQAPGVLLCNSPICPIKFPHAEGKFLQNGKPPCAQDITIFGGSNPPKFCWVAYEKCAAGVGTEVDIRIVQSFRDIHGNQTDPWAFAAEDQRWTQQLQQQEPQNINMNDNIPAGNRGRGGYRGRGNKGGDNREGERGGNEYRGGDFRGGQNRGCENRGGGFRGGSHGGSQHQHWRGEHQGGVFRGGRGGRGGDSQGGGFHGGRGESQIQGGGFHGGRGGNQTQGGGFHGGRGGSQPQAGEFRGGRGGGRGGHGGRDQWRG